MQKLLGPDAEEEWKEFLSFHTRKIHVKANQVILQQGDDVEGIFSITSGKVKVMQKTGEEERLIRLAGKDDILGHRGLGGNWKYPISAVAVVPTDLEFLPMHAFKVFARTNAHFVFNLMMFFAEELRLAEENKLQLPVLQRISQTIKMNLDAFGLEEGSKRLSYTISRRDIASHAGTTYETVIRTLAELNKRGVILLDGKTIHILDQQLLQQLAEGN